MSSDQVYASSVHVVCNVMHDQGIIEHAGLRCVKHTTNGQNMINM